MRTIRLRLVAPSAARRLFVTLTVMGALIAGLLSMHTIATAHVGGHSDLSGVSAGLMPHDSLESDPATVVACPDACRAPVDSSNEAIVATACILALIAAVLLLAAPRLATGRLRGAGPAARTMRAVAGVQEPRPPSLALLSISRR